MPKSLYDVIVIGTGAGGGMAIKTLCDAGLKVCALNAGRKLEPAKDFRNHRMPWEMKYRSFGDPQTPANGPDFTQNEYVEGVWEREIAYTTAPGTHWMWPRCYAVGGKTNFWGRSSARFGDIDFKAASRDGSDTDWPVSYDEIAPYYTRVERMIGVASTVIYRHSIFDAWTGSSKKEPRRPEFLTYRIALHNSRCPTTAIPRAISAATVRAAAMSEPFFPHLGSCFPKQRPAEIWNCEQTPW
jgi:choline dehydrogenase-like flavoprotein